METLTFGYGLAEAPRVDSAGNLYFSDAVRGGVYRRKPDGSLVTVVPKRRGVGGLVLHAEGGEAQMRKATRRLLLGAVLFSIAIALAFVNPRWSLAAYMMIPVLHVLPGPVHVDWNR